MDAGESANTYLDEVLVKELEITKVKDGIRDIPQSRKEDPHEHE